MTDDGQAIHGRGRPFGPRARTLLVRLLALGTLFAMPFPPARCQAEPSAADDLVSVESPRPWDYDPYRVLVWIASDDPAVAAATVREPLRDVLDRDFHSLWRPHFADAPTAVRSAAARGMDSLDFGAIIAADPVVAVKKDHPDAIRIRFPSDVGRYVGEIATTASRAAQVRRWATDSPQPGLAEIARRLVAVDADATSVRNLWQQEATQAVLLSYGMAARLQDPEPKLIPLPAADAVAGIAEEYDKIFVVRLTREHRRFRVEVVELETLMQTFGRVVAAEAATMPMLPAVIGAAITEAFSPTVRIEDAGTRTTSGLVRGGGLIIDPDSPGAFAVGDVILPMMRKDDRNGNPIQIGRLDWSYLIVKEVDGPKLSMEFHSGRAGGLQGRKNSRTFRTGLKARPVGDSTTLWLHARGNPQEPLIGYEIHERDPDSSSWSLVGRTDWNGRLQVRRGDQPLRLLYVKNGGAVLAKLPMVPGFTEKEVADLRGDDMRLQAEAYIRGVQNAIVDLVAIRELLAARIRLRLQRDQLEDAEKLLLRLRDQPTNEVIANDMGRKQTMFLNAVGRDANQRRKIDDMFSTTRELLSKHINPRILRDLEAEVRQAKDAASQ